jgi:hypothetical protein
MYNQSVACTRWAMFGLREGMVCVCVCVCVLATDFTCARTRHDVQDCAAHHCTEPKARRGGTAQAVAVPQPRVCACHPIPAAPSGGVVSQQEAGGHGDAEGADGPGRCFPCVRVAWGPRA